MNVSVCTCNTVSVDVHVKNLMCHVILAIAILGSTAKFNSRQYFRLYGGQLYGHLSWSSCYFDLDHEHICSAFTINKIFPNLHADDSL